MVTEFQNSHWVKLPEDWNSFIDEWNSSNDGIKVHTSGSTGSPKEISLTRQMLIRSALRTNSFFNIHSDCLLYSCVGSQFIGGKMMYIRANLAKAGFLAEKPSNRPKLSVSPKHCIDLLAVVPSQMIDILARKDEIPIIKNIIIGGSAINETLRKEIASSGLQCFETYGMTETASHIALRRVTAEGENPFTLLPGISIHSDENKCLIINLIEDQIEVHTHDIVEIIDEKHFLILGRADNVIITGGKKIIVEELENKLHTLLNRQVALTSEPDRKWGERLIAIVESDKNPDIKNIEMLLKSNLEHHEIPKEFIFISTLPRTLNGKTDRQKLRSIKQQ